MKCDIEVTDEFKDWFESLTEEEQVDVDSCVGLLIDRGASLEFPYSSRVKNARTKHMRELRIQHAGRPYRTLYAFDPRRVAILLIGGDKGGNDRWYSEFVPVADKLYEQYIWALKKEGLI